MLGSHFVGGVHSIARSIDYNKWKIYETKQIREIIRRVAPTAKITIPVQIVLSRTDYYPRHTKKDSFLSSGSIKPDAFPVL